MFFGTIKITYHNMDNYIKKLDTFTQITLDNYWKENIKKTNEISNNSNINDNDWIIVTKTNISEPFWGKVDNK